MSALIDITGQRFGRLVVIRRAKQSGKATMWLCRCDCGRETVVQYYNLKIGHSRSCGCLDADLKKARIKHGHTSDGHTSATYYSWASMIARCTNPKIRNWKDYGGRGISVCDRWQSSFENFLTDLGEKPEGLTLERTNNKLGYFPGNVRWATVSKQAQNRRSCKLTAEQVIAIRADPRIYRRIAEHYHVSRSMIQKIKDRQNWKDIP